MQALRLLVRPLARRASPPPGVHSIAPRFCLIGTWSKKLPESSHHHVFCCNSSARQSVLSSLRLFPTAHVSGVIFALTFGSLGGLCFSELHTSPKAVTSVHHDKREKIFVFSPKENDIIGNGGGSEILWWLRRLWVPFFLVVTVVLGWEHPLSLIVNLAILLLSTKPPPSSFFLWAEKRRLQQACQRQGLDRIKAQLNPASLMHVEIHDYLLFCVATASSFSQRLTVIGILNEWWIIYSSSSSFTGFGLSSLREFLSKSNQDEA